jgi:hypothetical protein
MGATAKARDSGRGPIFRAKPKVFSGLSDKLTRIILPFESPEKSAMEAGGGRNHNG